MFECHRVEPFLSPDPPRKTRLSSLTLSSCIMHLALDGVPMPDSLKAKPPDPHASRPPKQEHQLDVPEDNLVDAWFNDLPVGQPSDDLAQSGTPVLDQAMHLSKPNTKQDKPSHEQNDPNNKAQPMDLARAIQAHVAAQMWAQTQPGGQNVVDQDFSAQKPPGLAGLQGDAGLQGNSMTHPFPCLDELLGNANAARYSQLLQNGMQQRGHQQHQQQASRHVLIQSVSYLIAHGSHSHAIILLDSVDPILF